MSLARSFISDPLMNSPITKLSFVILNRVKNLNTSQWLHVVQDDI